MGDSEKKINWSSVFREAILNAPNRRVRPGRHPDYVPSEHDVDMAMLYTAMGFIFAAVSSKANRERPDINMDAVKVSYLEYIPRADRVEIILSFDHLIGVLDEHIEWISSKIAEIAMKELHFTIDKTSDKPPRLLLKDERAVL